MGTNFGEAVGVHQEDLLCINFMELPSHHPVHRSVDSEHDRLLQSGKMGLELVKKLLSDTLSGAQHTYGMKCTSQTPARVGYVHQ